MTHLANGVRHCGPLWATSAFMFEANNHVLLKMFHGTQHVPRQISETFMLAQRVHAIASRYFSDDVNPAVVSTFEKFAGNVPQKDVRVLALGSGKPATLTASQILAVMQLTNLPVHNRSTIVFHRFVANHQFYTSESYQRSTRHRNYAVRVEQQERKYGNIAGLYVVKPECDCSDVELQYCECTKLNIVFVNAMKTTGFKLYQDLECQIQSDFVRVPYSDKHEKIYDNET